ncbi:MAG: 3-methyl-2-oxobutanoate hydroxymethyltransferase [Actinobacteria bacterium]|nr:3-methyl-2-oxobutanoate hydroxymethyltransferase [Actinomycetota bacterium]
MSVKKVTVRELIKMKQEGRKIAMLTAYDYATAKILDEAGIDIVLVGDSLSNVFQGNETTLPVTVDEMLYHTKVVAKAVNRAMVVADMPFLSYQVSKKDAVYNAGRFLKEAGAQAVKIEGGRKIAHLVERLVSCGIPVMGHIGLTPQSVHALGGYRLVGREEEEQKTLLEDAKALEKAGCFLIVLEMVPAQLAKRITESVNIPTVGIGAGPHCDGQVLVVNDMLGLTDTNYRFVKRYANLKEEIKNAVLSYIDEVRNGEFPDASHSFN